jgi:Tfp pilus assembly protein PilE
LDQTNVSTAKNDIMQLLSKAQNTYQQKQQDDYQQLPKHIASWSNDYDSMVKPAPIRVQTTTTITATTTTTTNNNTNNNVPLDTSSSSCTSNASELKQQQQQQTNQVNPIIQRLLSSDIIGFT